jgi:glycerophosphoryl diester phosphodiesterase
MIKLPQIIGHRGACAYAPENTLESIQAAADMGVDWVELDVKLTADDVRIIFHDVNLERVTSGTGLVKDSPYSVIQELDAGSWFGDTFINTSIPTLEEAVELITELGLGFNLEIKPCVGREIETAQITLDEMTRIWDDHDKIMISSFSPLSLSTASEMLGGDWAIGYLMHELDEHWKKTAEHLGADTININAYGDFVSRDFVEDIIDEGYGILSYTINDPIKAKELLSWGVDGIFTDVPDVIRDEIYALQ